MKYYCFLFVCLLFSPIDLPLIIKPQTYLLSFNKKLSSYSLCTDFNYVQNLVAVASLFELKNG